MPAAMALAAAVTNVVVNTERERLAAALIEHEYSGQSSHSAPMIAQQRAPCSCGGAARSWRHYVSVNENGNRPTGRAFCVSVVCALTLESPINRCFPRPERWPSG